MMIEFPDFDIGSDEFLSLIVVIVLAARTFLLDLEEAAIQGYDEGLYAVGALNIFDGYWLVHHHTLASGAGQYVPHLQKPPLVPWIQAISMFVFGKTAFAARLPSALAAVSVAVFILYLGREFVDIRTGLIASVIFVTTPQVFTGTNSFRQATTDGMLILLGTLFIGFTWLSVYRDTRYFYVIGILAPLLVLTKSVQAGIFVIAVLPLVLLNLRQFISRRFLIAVSTTVVIICSWFVPMYLRFGHEFIERLILRQLFERTTGGLSTTAGGLFSFMKYPYIQHLFSLWDPWVYFFIIGIIVLPFIHQKGKADWLVLSVWSSLSIFIFFLFTGNHAHYILPMYVPGAIIIGTLARDAMENHRPAQVGIVVGLVGATLFSPRSPSPWAFMWNDLWGNKPGDIILIPLLVGIGVIVIFNSPLVKWLRSILGRGWFEDAKPTMIIVLILTFGFAISSPAIIQHQGAVERQQLALEANDEIPDSATIYFSETSDVHLKYLTVEFYTQNNFKGVPKETLNTSTEIQYAIILPQSGGINRSHRIISEMHPNDRNNSVKIVRFQ